MDSRVQLMSDDCQHRSCTLNIRHWRAFLNAKVKLEWSPRLVTCHEWNILKLALVICDLPKSVHG